VERIRTQHHEIARWLACGVPQKVICEQLGVTAPGLAVLKRSPAFQNLLLYYMAERDKEAISLSAKIQAVAGLAVDKVAEALGQPLENISAKFLETMTLGLLDRAGHSPLVKTANLTLGLSLSDIREIKEANRASTATLISAHAHAHSQAGSGIGGPDCVEPQAPNGSEDREPSVGRVDAPAKVSTVKTKDSETEGRAAV
jgi:hypothetical protein